MRRNNCWLAVLAVLAVVPILRHGLAGERLSDDYENAELQANRSKAAYDARGSNQPATSIRSNVETDSISRRGLSELSLETSQTLDFPRGIEQPDSPASSASVPSDSSDEIPCQRSTKLTDDDSSDEHQSWPRDLIPSSIHANGFSLSEAGSKLQNGLSKEDSLERSNKLETAEPFSEATRGSFAEIPRTIQESTAAGILGERRLSPWISRGAIKDSTGRANDVIHRVSSDRLAGLTRTREDETAREANQWRSSRSDVDSGHWHYSHVGRSSRGDDPLMTSRTEARKALGLMENRPLQVERSGGADAADAASEINARGDIGFPTSTEDSAREQTVQERSSQIDTSGNISTGRGTTERNVNGSGSVMLDKKPRGTGDLLGFEGRLRNAKIDKLMQSFPNRRRRPRRYIRSFVEKEENEMAGSSTDEEGRLANSQKSISSFTSKVSSRDYEGTGKRHEEHFWIQAPSHKSETTEFAERALGPQDISSKRRSTVNSDFQADNGGADSIQRENHAAFSASSGTISIHSVLDSHERSNAGREEGNFFATRDTLASDTPSKGYPSAEIEDIASAGFTHLHAAFYNATNETANADDFNFNEYVAIEDTMMRENTTANVSVADDWDVLKTESSYAANRETKDSVEGSTQSGEEDKEDMIEVTEGVSNNATDNPEDVFAVSSHSSVAANWEPTYSRSDMDSPTEGTFTAGRNDSIVSPFGDSNVHDNFEDTGARSMSKETEEKLKQPKNSIASAQLGQSSTNEGSEPTVSSSISVQQGSENDNTLPSKGNAKRSEVNDPSNSLVEENDHSENSNKSVSEKLNGSLTNGPVIIFKDEELRSQNVLNQNSRPGADEFDDNEPARRFTFARAESNDVDEERSLDNGTEDEINQNGRGKTNIEDHPTSTGVGTSSSDERPRLRKERKSRSSWMSGHNSTAKSVDLDPEVTSPPEWISNEGRREEAAGAASAKINSASRDPGDIPRRSSELNRSTVFTDRVEDRPTVTSELDERAKGSEVPSSIDDIASWPTSSSQLDHDASIAVSSVSDGQRAEVDVTVSSLANEEYSLASVEDVSPRNVDNSSHDLERWVQWPVKHSAVVEGDLVLGGLMMVHEREDWIICGPVMPQGGVQALEAMLYTLDRLNDREIVPGVKIGAHILDDCDRDTYGLEMAVDFIKGSISNIDGAEYHCNKTAVRKVISGVVGAASSVTSIQVANLLRLFRIPQVSFFSTSPELSNRQRFEYFSRTIPSDHYQVKAMVDIVLTMGWSYVSIIYEESNYGIKAFEELEELLGKYDICIAIKEKLVKDSGVAEETAYDNIVLKLLTKPRARGCIIFGSDQEVAGVMRAVRRCNATGAFSWIGSDGWSARGLVSNGNEPEVEGTLSVQPQANPVKGFEGYFLNLTVENNRRNPWFVEFWEDHFQCRYPNSSVTPYNKKYTRPCTTKERLTKQNTAFEDQLQFVSDAVMAFAYAFRDMHRDLCHGKPGLCDAMKPTNGTKLLKYLQEVNFEGLSGDKFKFDKNGDGPARYNIIHFKQTKAGKYKWVRVGKYLEGELRLNRSEIQFKLGHPQPPESVCSLPCEVGQAKKYVEGERCCWHCFNCTQYQIRHPKDETQCIPCRQGTVPDETHSTCRDIPEEFLRPESGWAIGAMSFSATGILITMCVCGVFLKHNDTPVVRASGRELSYVLLSGILLCYLVTFALVLRPTDIVCGIQRFAAGFCFTVVYAALLTKTNRISRIFNASKHSAKRPSFISPRSQLIICSGLVFVQILINGVWMIIDPARAMHHYPTREDNLLVCNSYIDASYMIAFAYPIMLIVVCTVYAVLTRKIPEAFNESKHIGFTMYTTCVIWLAFVPLYFGTGNNVALRITSMSVTISLSASVTIACLFSPKLYIILIRPERNVRQSMMPARYSTTKSSAVTATNASSMIAPITLTAATCDQNKTVKKHIITTMDCSTQSEYFEMEVKDQKNGKPPPTVVSRSTQTSSNSDKDSSTVVANKDSKENTATTKQLNNNARIGNGPVNQADVSL